MQCVEEYRTLPNAAAARALLGVTMVLPPGHQELTRRATPTVIMPVEVPLPPFDAASLGLDAASAAVSEPIVTTAAQRRRSPPPRPSSSRRRCQRHAPAHGVRRHPAARRAATSPSGRAGTGSPTSAIRSPSTTPCARRSASGTSRRCRSGCSAGPTRCRPPTTASPTTWRRSRSGRRATAPFCDEHGQDARRRRRLPRREGRRGAGRHRAADRRRPLPPHPRRAATCRSRTARRACRTCRCRARARASCVAALTDADVARAALLPLRPAARTHRRASTAACSPRTGYSGEIGYEIYCPPEGAEQLWQALLDQGAGLGIRPYGLAAVESLRIESGPDLHRLRLLPGPHLAVPREPGQGHPARRRRLPRPRRAGGRATTPASRTAW